jgi:hypothetical protein
LSVLALTATVSVQKAAWVSARLDLRIEKDKVRNFIGVGAESVSADL